MEFNLLTCELVGEGFNIIAIMKIQGKPVIEFNCETKHIKTALETLEKILGNLNLEEAIKLSKIVPVIIPATGGKK